MRNIITSKSLYKNGNNNKEGKPLNFKLKQKVKQRIIYLRGWIFNFNDYQSQYTILDNNLLPIFSYL